MNIIKSVLLSVIIITTLFLAACTQEKSTTSTEDSVPSDAQIPAQDENGASQNAQPSEVAGVSETDNGESSSAEPATTAEPTASTESAAPADPTESTEDAAKQSFAGNVPAPAFPTGLDWINTDGPLALTDLRGKVVLLDFWTYGCINCLHIIPELKALEEKYADELVVIGVHSAKFENEGDTENIENIVQRYELKHPVVNDNQYQIWSLYGARAWPTLVLIDPVGNVLGYHAGEDIYDRFDFIIGSMIEEFDQRGLVNRTPLSFNTSQERVESPLLFPGKVLADVEGDRLFISDSNHNRIVVTDFEGNVMEVIGDGQARLQDGDFETASFFRPQGLTLKDQNTLYVADTENHAIRAVNLADRTVETAAGNGEQSYISVNSAKAESLPLNSPWDVLYYDGILYIAMAGQHQIWAFDPESGEIAVYAGSGYEELTDGALLEGGLNQPSGLSTDGLLLYVADSESSSIRTADLDPAGDLATIVGTGLFEFGDIDGTGNEVRLQHPLGVAYDDGKLYVADTYNSKIKIVDPESRESISYLGGSESGWRDGSDALFNEPGGLSVGDGNLYIADTNNHVIRVADLSNGEVSTLVLIDPEGLLTRQIPGLEYTGKVVQLEPKQLASGPGAVVLNVGLPEGYKVNDLAPFSMEWSADGGIASFSDADTKQQITDPDFPISVPVNFSPGDGVLTGDLIIYFCESEAQSLCFIDRVQINIPLNVSETGVNELDVAYTIPQPEE